MYSIHNSRKINKYIKLPFKRIWFPLYFKNRFNNEKPLCIIVLRKNLPLDYLSYIKSRFPQSKAVVFYRDLRWVAESVFPDLVDNPIWDLQYTIDAVEAEKYGWKYHDEIESKIDVAISSDYPESDVFFAGKAKDRLPRLYQAYDIFSDAGLKVFYYLVGGGRMNKRLNVYSDKFMDYTEMLYYTVNTRCFFEINRDEAVCYTSGF